MYKYFIVFLLFSTAQIAICQLPNTQAYVFDMRQINDNTYNFSRAKYLSNFNPTGYNNQPSFIDERTLLMTVQMSNASQTEVYKLDLYQKTKAQMTNTPDGEYSPTVMPNGASFSCIREEFDGKKTQRLWRFPLNRSNNGERILADITGVGYHHWLSPELIALFIVGEPHTLVIANTRTGQQQKVSSDIGRSLQQFPNGHLVYLQKMSASTWYIKEVNPQNLKSDIVIEALEGSEDFIVTNDGTIFSGQGSKLYKYNKTIDDNWVEIGNFKDFNIQNITRLAYNGNRKLVIIDAK